MKLSLTDISRNNPLRFIVLLGIVSLFADMTYEGARSINGQYLSYFGASATVVGFVAGFGELIGYTLRIISGYFTDKTKQYWTIIFSGYVINLLAVPALAFTGNWELASMLMVIERAGKAIRVPARDALIAKASKEIGSGTGFAIHEALDQIGAFLSPLLISASIFCKGSYKTSYLLLLIPALIALAVLYFIFKNFKNNSSLKVKLVSVQTKGFSKNFWLYVIAMSFIALGYADFPIIAYHIKKHILFSEGWIPALYSLAMIVDAIAALILGKLFDRIGLKILIFTVVLSSLFSPLIFLGNQNMIIFGVVLWGIGMGALESIVKSEISSIVSESKMATAFGTFNFFFGIFWFLGSATIGILYDISINYLVMFSLLAQLISIPILFMINKRPVQ